MTGQVDTLWLAVPTALSEAAQPLALAGAGVLAFQEASASQSCRPARPGGSAGYA